jgi:uncharacterized protein (TIGR00290 family)
MSRPKALLAWSSGKDGAWALQVQRQRGNIEVVGLLTTLNALAGRVSMHGVREELLDQQARSAGLPVVKVPLPFPCSNRDYEAAMRGAMAQACEDGVTHVAFGDLFLEDVRAYREERLKGTGLSPLFPLWGMDTTELAREMLSGGLRAMVTCVDPRRLDPAYAGRAFDDRFLTDLPLEVDPCGERGEFHTCVVDGPMFAAPIPVVPGEVVERDGFVFADLVLAPPAR